MKISFWKIFSILGIVFAWAQAALDDGKITLEEAVALISQLAAALSLPLEFDVSKLLTNKEENREEVSDGLLAKR